MDLQNGALNLDMQHGRAALAFSIDMELRHSMDMQHGDMDMQHCNNVIIQQGHTWTCSTATDLQHGHGHGHTAWIWTCSTVMGMLHLHGHAAWT
jgi:hypothetical protein